MICDPRLFGKSYGRVFRNSLPPMPVTRDVADVQAFFLQGDNQKEEQEAEQVVGSADAEPVAEETV
jgi:ATP-dependent DNA helicase DinG